MNVATFLSYCHVFPVPSPLRFIYVDVAVMTHYNFPCQRHQDGWFAGISMSSVSLKPQQQLKWHTGLVEQKAVLVCVCVFTCVHGFMTVYQACGAWMFAHVPLWRCGWALVGSDCAFALAQSNQTNQDKYFCLLFGAGYIPLAIHFIQSQMKSVKCDGCHRSGSVNLCKSIQHTHTDWIWFVPP